MPLGCHVARLTDPTSYGSYHPMRTCSTARRQDYDSYLQNRFYLQNQPQPIRPEAERRMTTHALARFGLLVHPYWCSLHAGVCLEQLMWR